MVNLYCYGACLVNLDRIRSVWLLLLVWGLISVSSSRAQRSQHLSTLDGLHTNNITQLLRDRHDHMWIASYNGLHRHDGSSIKLYNRTGIPGQSMTSGENYTLCEDDEGYIWAAGSWGVNRIHPVSGHISNYFLRSEGTYGSSIGHIYAIWQDRQKTMWISSDAALFKLPPGSESWEQIPMTRDSSGVPSRVTGYITGKGLTTGFWIQVATGPVYYEYATGLFYHQYHNPKNLPIFHLTQPTIGANGGLYLDSLGQLYFTSRHRTLIRYHLQTQQLDSVAIPFPADAWHCCLSITGDRQGNIWIGTRKGGLLIYQPSSQSWTPIRSGDPSGLLQSDYIHSLCEDYQGRMWVATDNGIDIIDYTDRSVQSVRLKSNLSKTIAEQDPGRIQFDGHSRIYIPYWGSGFGYYDLAERAYHHIIPNDVSNQINYIFPAEKHAVWIINRSELMTASVSSTGVDLRPSNLPFASQLKASPGHVVGIDKIHDQSIFFKKSNGLIFHYTGGDTLTRITSSGYVKLTCLSPDEQYLWYLLPNANPARRHIGTGQTDTFDLYPHIQRKTYSYSMQRDLLDDGAGHLWISSLNGVLRFHYLSDSLDIYTQAEGLSHGFNYAFALDGQGDLWTCNLEGIDVYDPDHNRFHPVHALPSGKYTDAFGSSTYLQDGRLAFLSGQNLHIIDPGAWSKVPKKPLQFRWHHVRVNEQPDAIPADRRLRLRHDQNRLIFHFSVLEYEQPRKIRYAYQLSPLDTDWIELGNQNELSLHAVSPGNYQLRVRATDAFGQHLPHEISLSLTITPPWYATWWFRIILVLLLITGIFLYVQRRIKVLHRKNQIRDQVRELESRALRAQMNPHFIFNCLNAIQECIVTEKVDLAYTYLSRFSKLLRRILHASDQNVIPLHDELETLRLYLSLEAMRFSQSFSYQLTVDEQLDTEDIMIPPLIIQPYVENAIWHGLIHKDGDKQLHLSFTRQNRFLVCRIQDNGIGRKKAEEIRARKMGSGLFESRGTKLTEQRINILMEAHPDINGIQILDEMDEHGESTGTTVVLTLPLHQEKL